MDKKRNILIRELMELIDQAKDIQTQNRYDLYRRPTQALQKANIELGISCVMQMWPHRSGGADTIRIKTRSIMGTEIPLVECDPPTNRPTYAFYSTNSALDEARAAFEEVKSLTVQPVHDRECGLPPGGEYQEDAEARQRAEEHHNPPLRAADQGYQQRAGGEGA